MPSLCWAGGRFSSRSPCRDRGGLVSPLGDREFLASAFRRESPERAIGYDQRKYSAEVEYRPLRNRILTRQFPDPDLPRKAIAIHDDLCAEYGCPIPYFHALDPLSELISSLLSHRTKNRDSDRAFKQLTAQFPTWEAVRDAPTKEIEKAIAPCTWPEQKAPRIQQVLHLIGEWTNGEWLLDFLEDMSVPEARAWLESLPGVGPKTSAAVLCFSRLRGRALPVDSHHHRVAQRLGLIPQIPVGPSHALLEALLPDDWDAQQVYDHHEVMMLHGQRCCYYKNPDCDRCVVLSLCPHGQYRSLEKGSSLRERPR
jgi:endonuclease III